MRTSQTTTRILAIAGAVTLAAAMSAPAANADGGNGNGNGNSNADVETRISGGSITSSIDNLDMGSVDYSFDTQTNSGVLDVGVSDTRGLDAGWNITVQSTAFAYTGNSQFGSAIPAANFALGTPGAPQRVSGKPTAGLTAGSGGSLDVPRTVLTAAANKGQGVYDQELPATLTIPGYSSAGKYEATVTVTVTSGPGGEEN